MIAATLCVQTDGDVVGCTIRHLLKQDVDRIYVSYRRSTDETVDMLAEFDHTAPDQVYWEIDDDPIFRQHDRMNYLAARAGLEGAVWIVPFDADEWVSGVGDTVGNVLRHSRPDVGIAAINAWLHLDWLRKVVNSGNTRWRKHAYRWSPTADLHVGGHGVSGVEGRVLLGGLSLREWQFRSFEHFVRKRDLWLPVVKNPDLYAPTQGAHIKAMDGLDEDEMRLYWERFQDQLTIMDPIPSTYRPL